MTLVAQNIFFGLLAVAMVVGAVRVVTTRNIIHAALWLVLVLAGVAAQFILLIAEFAAVTQVLVYIGAIVVLFLFGIMLTRAPLGNSLDLDRKQMIMGAAVAVPLLAVMAYALWDSFEDTELNLATAAAASVTVVEVVPAGSEQAEAAEASSTVAVLDPAELAAFQADVAAADTTTVRRPFAADDGVGPATLVDALSLATESDLSAMPVSSDESANALGELLSTELAEGEVAIVDPSNTKSVSDTIFSAYIVPFEAVSVLLLAALIGAVVLARRD